MGERKNIEFIFGQLCHPLKNNPKCIPDINCEILEKNVGVFNMFQVTAGTWQDSSAALECGRRQMSHGMMDGRPGVFGEAGSCNTVFRMWHRRYQDFRDTPVQLN